MRSLGVMVVAGAVLALGSFGWADDDHAQPRGGGSGGSSSVGSSHHSGGSGSGSSSSSSGSSSSSSGSSYRDSSGSSGDSGSSSSFRSSSTGAQQRHPRAGTGTGWRYGRGRGGYIYSPYWGGYSGYYGLGYGWGYGWSPYYNSWYGYDPYYGYGYGYGSGYGYGHRYGYAGEGSVRVLVEPKDARVYVDGYYAGVVDDFDGLFQRLRISPGRHEIALKLDGYRSQTFKVYVPYDDTLKLHYKMVRGTGDDVSQVIGRPEDEARDRARYAQREREARADDGDEDDDDAGYASDRESDQRGERGVVRLDVRPADASVYVDGAFRGTGRELRQLRLTPGRHHLEVVRPGYRTMDREIDVRSGEDADVDIDLDRS